MGDLSHKNVDPLWKEPNYKTKALCRTCGSLTHYASFCFLSKKKPVKKIGKVTKEWILTRRRWADITAGGSIKAETAIWYCHYCGVKLVLTKNHPLFITNQAFILTLDHIKPRSSHPELRNDPANLVPSCNPDNILKGSMNYKKFLEKYYPDKIS